ncbi:hypothetical protein [Paucibacter soli]|uniref:hypothetical protein n=1 Tax=Paucibacter soli TaxID=3133433 RepID=UPI00309F978B
MSIKDHTSSADAVAPSVALEAITVPGDFPGVKVRCESPHWSRKLQLLLKAELGCTWGADVQVPWNDRRPFLMVRLGLRGWFFSWGTEGDFERCSLPEYTARGLVMAHRALSKKKVTS